MTASLKMKLIVAAIIFVIVAAVILVACGIVSSLSFGSLLVVILSFLVGMGIGAYIYKIYRRLKDNK